MPWHDHNGEPRFICDVMTEGLAKQLRLYGVDAAAVESKGKGSRHLVYRPASPLPSAPPLPSDAPLPCHLTLPLLLSHCLLSSPLPLCCFPSPSLCHLPFAVHCLIVSSSSLYNLPCSASCLHCLFIASLLTSALPLMTHCLTIALCLCITLPLLFHFVY